MCFAQVSSDQRMPKTSDCCDNKTGVIIRRIEYIEAEVGPCIAAALKKREGVFLFNMMFALLVIDERQAVNRPIGFILKAVSTIIGVKVASKSAQGCA